MRVPGCDTGNRASTSIFAHLIRWKFPWPHNRCRREYPLKKDASRCACPIFHMPIPAAAALSIKDFHVIRYCPKSSALLLSNAASDAGCAKATIFGGGKVPRE